MQHSTRPLRGFLIGALLGASLTLPDASAQSMPIPTRSRHVGINLAGLSYWTTQFPFADMTKNSAGWEPAFEPGADKTPYPAAKDGSPLSLKPGQKARIVVAWDHTRFASGAYTVLWDGDGGVSVPIGRVTVKSSARNRLVVEPTDLNHQIKVQIDRTNPADPVRNVRFLWPGTEATHATQRFNPLFLARIAPFSTIRFMDWGATNNSELVEWADRPRLEDATFTARGVPIEMMIELANTLGADPWFCIPHKASDDYVRQFALLVRDKLDPRLKAHVEYSNEVWNQAFHQTSWALAQSQRLGLPRPHGLPSGWYAKRSVEMFRIVDGVFGPTARERVIRVLAGQAVWTQFLQDALAFRNAAAEADALAIAPYFHSGSTADPKNVKASLALSNEQLFEQMRGHLQGEVKRGIEANVALAKKHKLKLLAYEAGSHDISGAFPPETQDPLAEVFKRAHRDPRMRDVYDEYWSLWIKSGGDTMLQYNDIGHWSKWGMWSALERVTDDPAASPKYRALLDVIARHPCAAKAPCR